MKEARGWILTVGILAIFAWVGYMVVKSVEQTTKNSIAPINQITGSLATQVSEILNPTPTIVPDPITIVHQVRPLARLETIQYSVEKIITAENRQDVLGGLFGDRLLFVAHGTVIAGIDLSKVGEDDIWFEGNQLYFRLPQAEVFVATLDNKKSYVYDRETGLFTKGDVNLETEARRAAEEEIAKSALEDGILEQAQLNAEQFMSRFLRSLGFNDVIFVVEEGSE